VALGGPRIMHPSMRSFRVFRVFRSFKEFSANKLVHLTGIPLPPLHDATARLGRFIPVMTTTLPISTKQPGRGRRRDCPCHREVLHWLVSLRGRFLDALVFSVSGVTIPACQSFFAGVQPGMVVPTGCRSRNSLFIRNSSRFCDQRSPSQRSSRKSGMGEFNASTNEIAACRNNGGPRRRRSATAYRGRRRRPPQSIAIDRRSISARPARIGWCVIRLSSATRAPRPCEYWI